ncbi:MAG TPA: hypothetical protein VFN67_24880 [Polyangiales bacterium]|nr:hypothetical protein [Polyangiales bacterium]
MDAGRVPTDGGGPRAPTPDAAGGDAAQEVTWDAGNHLSEMDPDAGASDTPPIAVDAGEPVPRLDAGHPKDADASTSPSDAAVGGGMDASVDPKDASVPAPDAGLDAGTSVARVCAAGQQLGGYCWFLGPTNRSCNTTCAAHGGYEASLDWIGTPAQGGSRARCDAVLSLLQGVDADTTTAGTRTDDRGVGCHLFQSTRWWLTAPDFKPAAYYLSTRIACSCFDN